MGRHGLIFLGEKDTTVDKDCCRWRELWVSNVGDGHLSLLRRVLIVQYFLLEKICSNK